jgi:tRNA dimethylallyltransferase
LGCTSYTGFVPESGQLPLIVVAGPTASGKSHLAIRLALEFSGEIVNCDSLQLYRGFDIGTAKPSAAELAQVAHHLINVLDPLEESNAGDWARMAAAAVEDIASRGKLPVIAGGTGFYVRALLQGLAPGPQRDPALRKGLASREARRPGFLHRLLRRLDPATAARIHANDLNKLTRAVEICMASGRSASEVFAAGRAELQGYRALKLVLNPPRDALHRAIESRAGAMWRGGLLDEVRGLLDAGVPPGAKPFESLGYKEALACIQGRMSEVEAIERTIIGTRQYAKRQITWFRRESGVEWIEGFGHAPETARAAASRVSAFLNEFTIMKVC